MVKANRPNSQKTGTQDTSSKTKTTREAQTAKPASIEEEANPLKGKQSGKERKTPFGGTAVQGAKSTQSKEPTTGTPSNQQPEYYNREMRRRMQQMGTGPYSERASVDPRERRRKRKERIQERQDRIRHTVDAKGPSRDIKLGRRNTYFLIGLLLAVIILITLFIIIRHPF